jgi:hypothetical protein
LGCHGSRGQLPVEDGKLQKAVEVAFGWALTWRLSSEDRQWMSSSRAAVWRPTSSAATKHGKKVRRAGARRGRREGTSIAHRGNKGTGAKLSEVRLQLGHPETTFGGGTLRRGRRPWRGALLCSCLKRRREPTRGTIKGSFARCGARGWERHRPGSGGAGQAAGARCAVERRKAGGGGFR